VCCARANNTHSNCAFILLKYMSQNFCIQLTPTATANGYPKCNHSVMKTRSSNFRPLDFVARSVRCSLELLVVVGDCHGQSLLAGVQNNT
jgi:hypothetical protein